MRKSSDFTMEDTLDSFPFYCLSDSELHSFLCKDKISILEDNSELHDYITKIDNSKALDNLNFSYVTDVEFNTKVRGISKYVELAVIHLNIRSLNCNHRALCQFLNMLVIKFDVVVLSEIWSTNIDFYCNILDGYTFYYELSKDSRVGGIGMYIKNSFTHHERQEYKLQNSSCTHTESIWFEISKNQQKYIIGGVYRHPNQNIQDFTKQMDIVLEKLSNQLLPCVIAGDVNIDLTKCTSSRDTADYVDCILTNNFMPVILMPTRITSRTASLIDHMYYLDSNRNRKRIIVKSGNFLQDISDHLPNYILLLNDKKYENSVRPMVRIYSERNKQKFKDELSTADWNSVYSCTEVNESYNKFIAIVTTAFDRCFTQTRLSRRRMRDKPWITSALKKQ